MRWYWIDRFIEFESGNYAKAVKNVSLAEEHLHDHFPGYPVMPQSLVIEGLAQTGGLLVCEHGRFTEKVFLAKIPKVQFFGEAFPGDQLIYTTTIEHVAKTGAIVKAVSHKADVLHAKLDIVFACLSDENRAESVFGPAVFLAMMQTLGGFEVGAVRPSAPLEPARPHFLPGDSTNEPGPHFSGRRAQQRGPFSNR